MKNPQIKRLLFSFAVVLFGIPHLVILLGLAMQGMRNMFSSYFMPDRLYGFLFAVIGILFSIIVIQILRRYMTKDGLSRIRSYVLSNEKPLFVTGIFLIALILFREELFSSLLYGGYVFTSLLVAQARLGILRILPFDILDYGATTFYWFGQFYYLYIFVGWATRVFTCKKNA